MKFSERLRAGERLLAASVSLSVDNAELLGNCGFDWLFIDPETLPITREQVQHMIRASTCTGVDAVVRLNSDRPEEIRQTLDMGAAGVIVPLVKTAEQTQAIVAAAKYPPAGERGLAGGRAQGYGYGASLQAYVADANQKTAIIVMVEEAEGLGNVESIAAVEGLDGIFVGPGDLSMSLGCLGEHLHDSMRAAYRRIGAAARANGIGVGIFPSSQEMYELCFGEGYRFFLAGLDTALLRNAAAERLKEMRAWSVGND